MRPTALQNVKLQPADPFDLIRWLARSQSDPRKAVAELVQNSIDAQSRNIRVERRRLRGTPALVVRDDGEGVLPDRSREEALRYIATHIGHSRKRNLSPRERQELVITGKYGVGLLGFWALGHRLEIRSRVGGSPLVALQLVEDEPKGKIVELPLPLHAPSTYTEVVVLELHETAQRSVGGRRLSDYLAAELRGPIVALGVNLEVFDGMARGLAQKLFKVVPRRFVGERLEVPAELPVDGFSPARVELYLARGAERPAIQVSCAGTLVADDIAELHGLDIEGRPWAGCELTGLIDFPGFTVPPGTRRGVVPDQAAEAFVRALEKLRETIEAQLSRLERERQKEADRQIVHELRRALRGLRNRLPQYELARVTEGNEVAAAASPGEELPLADEEPQPPVRELFPPGPLAEARIVPDRIELPPGRERRVRGIALDAEGRRLREGLTFEWIVEGAFSLVGEGPRPAVVAAGEVPEGTQGRLLLEVKQSDRSASAEAALSAVGPSENQAAGVGIPEPELIDDPTGAWRSRFDGERWRVNASHEDYVALRAESRARLRYLLALLAREIVLRTRGGPGSAEVADGIIEVLAHAERNLRGI